MVNVAFKYVPQTAATTFAFSSLLILLLCCSQEKEIERERKEERMRLKKREWHELQYTEIENSASIRLASTNQCVCDLP